MDAKPPQTPRDREFGWIVDVRAAKKSPARARGVTLGGMRALAFAALLIPSVAVADDLSVRASGDDGPAVQVGAALGAGGQGDAIYGGVDLRLDVAWGNAKAALGGRLVWLDGDLRDDYASASDAIRVLRALQLGTTVGETQLGLAGGALAPPTLGHVVDGYRVRLDDRPRTGARAALANRTLGLQLDIDDVVDPGLVAGALDWQFSAPWGMQSAVAVDPVAGEAAIEMGILRRFSREGVRTDVGGGAILEPGLGIAAIGYVNTAIDHAGARWTTSTELRAGQGTVGAAFGPLHRLERDAMYMDAQRGWGGAFAAGVAHERGWIQAGVRRRTAGWLGTLAAGAPLHRRVQGAGWIAATRDVVAGAAAVRMTLPRRLSTSLELGRFYDVDAMAPSGFTSVTAWLSITNE